MRFTIIVTMLFASPKRSLLISVYALSPRGVSTMSLAAFFLRRTGS